MESLFREACVFPLTENTNVCDQNLEKQALLLKLISIHLIQKPVEGQPGRLWTRRGATFPSGEAPSFWASGPAGGWPRTALLHVREPEAPRMGRRSTDEG